MKSVPLADVLDSSKSGFASGKRDAEGVIQLRMNNVTSEGALDLSKLTRIPATRKQIEAATLQRGDVLFNCTNSPELVGKSCYFPGSDEPFVFSNHFVRLRAKPSDLDSQYLARWLASVRLAGHFEHGCVRWVNQATFRKEDLLALKIPLPPLPEQKRIAKILDAADALRAKRRESLAQLDALLQSTFLEMFGDPVENPKGLEMRPMGEVCDVRDGTHDSPKYQDSGFPLLTSKNFRNGQIDYDGAALISEEDFRQINRRSKVDVGDLVMPMIGTIGNPVLVTDEPRFAIKNVALIKFLPNSPDNYYVRTLLTSHYFDHITSKSNRGGTQKFVALKDLRSLPLPIPPAPAQQKFRATVCSIEQHAELNRTHATHLDTLFASLQQRAFAGQL